MIANPTQGSSADVDRLARIILLTIAASSAFVFYLIYRSFQKLEEAVKQFALQIGLKPFSPGLPVKIPLPFPQGSRARVEVPYSFTGFQRGIETAVYQANQGFGMSGSAHVVLALKADLQAAAPPPASLQLKDAYSIQQGPWTLISVKFREATPEILQALLDFYCKDLPR